MSVPTLELLLLAIGAGAGCVAALFAVLCFVRAKRPEGTLTKDNAPHLLRGAVAGVVGNESGVVSGVINLESSGVEAPDWRPRHDGHYHEA